MDEGKDHMRLALKIVLTCVVGWAVGCTAIYDETSTQCRTEADCRSRGPEFAETTCSAERVCIAVAPAALACSTNQECSDKNGGQPFRCIQQTHQCVPLTSPECPRLLGERQDWLDDNSIPIGVLYLPTFPGTQLELAVENARQEIRASLGGGLPGATPGAPKRPLVPILCQTEASANGLGSNAQAKRAIRHLSEVVRVPAMIGPSTAPTILENFDTLLKPNKVATFLPLGIPPGYTAAVDQGLIVRMTAGSDGTPALLANPLITDLLGPKVYADGIAPVGTPLKVHYIYATDASDAGAVSIILQQLKFNGLSTIDNGANFKATPVGDAADRIGNPNPQSLLSAAIAQSVAFQPHIVIISSPPTLGPTLLVPLDNALPAPKPLYLTTLSSWATQAVPTIGNRNALRLRYFGAEVISSSLDSAALTELEITAKSKFPELGTQALAPQAYLAYDAMYVLSYAIVAAGAVPIDGAAVAQGVRRLSSGEPIRAHPMDLPKGMVPLQSGGSILFQGISGALNFDSDGFRAATARLFCVAAVGGVASSVVRPGYALSTATGQVSGSFTCPP
jgi:hypothetical protein